MKKLLQLVSLLGYACCFAQAPEGYYSTTEGLSGYELKTALKNIIDDIDDGNGYPYHQDQGYGALFYAYANESSGDSDVYYENDGTVLDMYSEVISGDDPYNYTHFQDQCGNYSSEGDCYNREHLVPQSTFNSAAPMKNDYFHVVPSDGSVNGARGSYPFGEVGNPSYISSNGSMRGDNTFTGYSGTVFEPIDEFKGDIARSVLYFAIRYEDEFNSSWSSNGVLANNPQDFFVDWYIDLLLSWHLQDPVSQREIDRNDNGFQFQGNRNPLIDHPEFAIQIWGDFQDNEPPTAPQNLQATNITESSIELSWEASQDNEGIALYIVEQDLVEIAQIPPTNLTYTSTDLAEETLYNYRVYAIDLSGNMSNPSENLEVVTLAEFNYLLNEDFEDCSTVSAIFSSISEESDINWMCHDQDGENNSQSYMMNGFQNGQQVPSLDWLITTNPINFEDYENEKISFWSSASYGNTKLELLYSSSYNGNENPSNYEWEQVPNVNIPTHPEGNGSLFTFEANSLDISDISGEVYIAFRYNTTNGDLATRWIIDNVIITGEQYLSNESFDNELDVLLYPNPSKNKLVNMKFSSDGMKKIEIFDVTGKRLLKTETEQMLFEKNLNNFSSGIYFVKIYSEEQSVIKRLIIN